MRRAYPSERVPVPAAGERDPGGHVVEVAGALHGGAAGQQLRGGRQLADGDCPHPVGMCPGERRVQIGVVLPVVTDQDPPGDEPVRRSAALTAR